MQEQKIKDFVISMAQKYEIGTVTDVTFSKERISIGMDGQQFNFRYGTSDLRSVVSENAVPFFYWRIKRRYTEMKRLLDTKMVEIPLAMRIHHIVPASYLVKDLYGVLLYEFDLAEFLLEDEINQVFADISGNTYTNVIASTVKNRKLSLESGISQQDSEPVLLHEIVARTGIVSDTAVDTQMVQYPVYVIKGHDVVHYTDTDYELYGVNSEEADIIRYILYVLSDPGMIPKLQKQAIHLQQVIDASKKSSSALSYTMVEAAQ